MIIKEKQMKTITTHKRTKRCLKNHPIKKYVIIDKDESRLEK